MSERAIVGTAPPPLRAGGCDVALSERCLRPIADYLLALADATRLRLVLALSRGERSVAGLADEVGADRDRASRHLAVLRRAGLVACRRERGLVLYRLASPDVAAVCDAACGASTPGGGAPSRPTGRPSRA